MSPTTHRASGLVLKDHTLEVPLDHARPAGEKLRVFAREVVATEKEGEKLPWLLFLQGGPGFASPRPSGRSGWLQVALSKFRVLLLDQRGTGLSTPVTCESLAKRGDARAQADYLHCFRADAIVADAEAFRRELAGEGERWTVLGQSYGGFCIAHYLSAAPAGLAGVVLTGGLPPLTAPAEEVYRRTYATLQHKNERYFARYPADQSRAAAIARHLAKGTTMLPTGGMLTPRLFQQLGICLGASDGYESLHYLLEGAFEAPGELSYSFLRGVENALHFETNPIYALLHEAIYCQGSASRWAAERVRQGLPQFEHDAPGGFLFTGEMIYPWMFEEYPRLRPMRDVAQLLADREDWPQLYDPTVLAANTVPCAAAVYHDDLYVDRELSLASAAAIRGTRVWVTNQFEHNALRAEGKDLLERLLGMLSGVLD